MSTNTFDILIDGGDSTFSDAQISAVSAPSTATAVAATVDSTVTGFLLGGM